MKEVGGPEEIVLFCNQRQKRTEKRTTSICVCSSEDKAFHRDLLTGEQVCTVEYFWDGVLEHFRGAVKKTSHRIHDFEHVCLSLN